VLWPENMARRLRDFKGFGQKIGGLACGGRKPNSFCRSYVRAKALWAASEGLDDLVIRIGRVEQRILLIHGPPGEYIIHTRTFVGSRFNRGCRTLWVVRVRVLTFSRAGLSSMRNPLQRHYGRGDLHFITFSCYRRRPYLGKARARDRFVKILGQVRSRYAFQLLGYVVMPEHVHLIVCEPKKGTPSQVLQVLKQRVSRALRRRPRNASAQLSLPFCCREPEAPAFWQRRFYDFNVWSSGKLREKLNYMHGNPVQRRLVRHPRDWPWSSWSFYATGEPGLTEIDTLGVEKVPAPSGNSRKRQSPHPL